MNDPSTFCPEFSSPPLHQARIAVQFSPFVGFKAGHFGLFWAECLGLEDWHLLEDGHLIPTEYERFGDKRLNPPVDEEEPDFPQVRMRLANATNTRLVDFQANRLRYSWTVGEDKVRPSYATVKQEFSAILDRLPKFAEAFDFGSFRPNLWEVVYVNIIPQGSLWDKPSDWDKVLPKLFHSGGPQVAGHEWATFSGEWYFEIVPQLGRVKVRTQKVVANQDDKIALLVEITARGEIAPDKVDWETGMDAGHASALRVFFDLTSPEAHQQWGFQS